MIWRIAINILHRLYTYRRAKYVSSEILLYHRDSKTKAVGTRELE